jgi:opacity protein-like surface antigen
MVGVLAVVALALLVAGPAFAQDKEVVVAGGWAPQYFSANGGSITAPLGLFGDVAVSVTKNIQIVGDLGYARKSESDASVSFLTATGGARYVIPSGSNSKVSPFVEGLVGLGYISGSVDEFSGSRTGLAFGVGGGVDVQAAGKLNVRLQANYFLNRISGVNVSEFRFGLGISGRTKI